MELVEPISPDVNPVAGSNFAAQIADDLRVMATGLRRDVPDEVGALERPPERAVQRVSSSLTRNEPST